MNFFMSHFEGNKTKTNLMLGFGILLLILSLIGVSSIYSVRQQDAVIQRAFHLELQGISHVKDAQLQLVKMSRAMRMMALSPNLAQREAAKKNLMMARDALHQSLYESEQYFFQAQSLQRFASIKILLFHELENVQHVLTLMEKSQDFRSDEVAQFLNMPDILSAFDQLYELMSEQVRQKEQLSKLAAQNSTQFSQQIQQWTIALLVCGWLISVSASLILGTAIHKPLEHVSHSIQDLAKGELYGEVPYTEFSNMVGTIARALIVLQTRARHADDQHWVKASVFDLGSHLQIIDNVDQFTEMLLATLNLLVGAHVSLLYVVNVQTGAYELRGSLGLDDIQKAAQHFLVGEGLCGQCAAQCKTLMVESPSDAC